MRARHVDRHDRLAREHDSGPMGQRHRMNAELRTSLFPEVREDPRQLLLPSVELEPLHLDAVSDGSGHTDEGDDAAASGQVQRAAERFDVERFDGDLDVYPGR